MSHNFGPLVLISSVTPGFLQRSDVAGQAFGKIELNGDGQTGLIAGNRKSAGKEMLPMVRQAHQENELADNIRPHPEPVEG